MNIEVPKGWRKGQTVFNFLQWLATDEGEMTVGSRLADTFYIEDDEFDEKWEKFLTIYKQE